MSLYMSGLIKMEGMVGNKMLICGILTHYSRNKNKQTNLVILKDF